jgi:hypothetical protein
MGASKEQVVRSGFYEGEVGELGNDFGWGMII